MATSQDIRRKMKLVSSAVVLFTVVISMYILVMPSLQAQTSLPSQISGPALNKFVSLYPTYQISSWQGAGLGFATGPDGGNFVNETWIQTKMVSTASMLFPWSGIWYAGWCDGANTTSSTIYEYAPPGSTSVYNPQEAKYISEYMMPYMIEFPLDGYGTCLSWAKNVVNQYPDLITYNISGRQINYNKHSYVRVDDINFARQVYNDLVNIKNNLLAVKPYGPQLLKYWYGIDISSIASDHGGYDPIRCDTCNPVWQNGGWMLGNSSIVNFAQSPQCSDNSVNLTFGSCSFLVKAARGQATTVSGKQCCSTLIISKILVNYHLKEFNLWSDGLYELGIAYAAYNFTQRYGISHPFQIALSRQYSLLFNIQPSQYPYPYNKSSIESLNLASFLMKAGAYAENAGLPQRSMVSSDVSICGSLKNPYNNLPGGFLSSVAYSTTTVNDLYKYVRNQIYYIPRCASSAIMEPGNLDYSPSAPYFSLLTSYGTLLNRIKSLGYNQYTLSSLGASFSCNGGCFTGYGSNYRYAGATNVTLLGSGGQMLLAWFYTNKTSAETVSFNMNGANYGFGKWIAISAFDWSVVGSGNTNSISFTVNIPAAGWNPVFIIDLSSSSDLSPLYSNIYVNSALSSSGTVTYVTSGPHMFSSWLIVESTNPPSSVSASNTGQVQNYQSISSLNNSFIGMRWSQATKWQNLTQTGWYYDPTNKLLFIHFVGGSQVSIAVSYGQSTQSSTSSSTSLSTSTSTSSSSSYSTKTTTSSTTTTSSSSISTTSSTTSSTTTSTSTTTTSSTTVSTTTLTSSTSQTTSQTSISTTSKTANSTSSTSSSSSTTETFDFSIFVSNSTLYLRQGSEAFFYVYLNTVKGVPQNVSLTTVSPSGITVTFSPYTGRPSFVSRATVHLSSEVPEGTYLIEIVARSGEISHSVEVSVQVLRQSYFVTVLQPSVGGTTSPPPSSYQVEAGTYFVVTAIPYQGWKLAYWLLDGLRAGNGSSIGITVNKNMTIEPFFVAISSTKVQSFATVMLVSNFQLANVTVDGVVYHLPASFDWALGSKHTLSIVADTVRYKGITAKFAGWGGFGNIESKEISFTVNRSMVISASYDIRTLVSLTITDSRGIPLAPQAIILASNMSTMALSNTTAWLSYGTVYNVSGIYWEGMYLQPLRVTEFRTSLSPINLTVPVSLYYYTVRVVDFLGMPVSGAEVTVTTNSGQTYSSSTDSNGLAYFNRVSGIISSVKVSYLGLANTLNLQGSNNPTIEVSILLSYPVTLFASMTSTAAFLFLVLKKYGKI